jgi:glycolate oxidase iron-sulfur subunit
VELADAHLCCGSAGTYNIDQPELAAALGQKKARAILATGVQVVVSGNIGCINQIRLHLGKLGTSIPVRHTMQILRDAYSQAPDVRACRNIVAAGVSPAVEPGILPGGNA